MWGKAGIESQARLRQIRGVQACFVSVIFQAGNHIGPRAVDGVSTAAATMNAFAAAEDLRATERTDATIALYQPMCDARAVEHVPARQFHTARLRARCTIVRRPSVHITVAIRVAATNTTIQERSQANPALLRAQL